MPCCVHGVPITTAIIAARLHVTFTFIVISFYRDLRLCELAMIMRSITSTSQGTGSALARNHGGRCRSRSVGFSDGDLKTIEESVVSSSRPSSSLTASTKSYARPYFRSRKITKDEIQKPWLQRKRTRWPTIIPCIGLVVGLIIIVGQVYGGWSSVDRHKYCLVMEDSFDGPTLNTSLWTQEVQLGGFG